MPSLSGTAARCLLMILRMREETPRAPRSGRSTLKEPPLVRSYPSLWSCSGRAPLPLARPLPRPALHHPKMTARDLTFLPLLAPQRILVRQLQAVSPPPKLHPKGPPLRCPRPPPAMVLSVTLQPSQQWRASPCQPVPRPVTFPPSWGPPIRSRYLPRSKGPADLTSPEVGHLRSAADPSPAPAPASPVPVTPTSMSHVHVHKPCSLTMAFPGHSPPILAGTVNHPCTTEWSNSRLQGTTMPPCTHGTRGSGST